MAVEASSTSARKNRVELYPNIGRLIAKLSLRRRWQLVSVIFLMLVGAVAEIASLGAVIPFLAVISGPDQSTCKIPLIPCQTTIGEASMVFGVIVIVAAAIRLLLLYVSNRFTFALGADIGNEVYRRTIFQPYKYQISRNTSEIIAGINKANQLVQQVINPLVQGLVSLIIAVAIFITLFHVDALSASVGLIVFGFLYILSSLLTRRTLRSNSQIISKRESRRIQTVQEGFGGIRDVIIDNTQSIYIERFSELNSEQRQAHAINSFIRNAPRYTIEGLGMLLMIGLVWWIGQRSSLADAIPILGAMALGAQKLLPHLHQLFYGWASVTGNQAVLADVLDLLDNEIPPEHCNIKSTSEYFYPSLIKPSIPFISIAGLHFRYSDKGGGALEGISLAISKGERIGFVGKTGSGKSTLIDLIMGLLEPQSGAIVIEGEALVPRNRRAWHARIAHVPQTIFLSDASIAENIALGCELADIDMMRVEDAARKAHLDEFIKNLPQGYTTLVGERGVRLSGGQRQRIGLARAMYKNADVLILDEATSALDDRTENAIMDSIDNLGDKVTVLMIAHRISTLAKCDRIIELDSGRIKRICSYHELSQGK